MATDEVRRGRKGQAIVEFVVAMVVIMVLFAGILQYCRLGLLQSRAMTEARRLAGVKAMQDLSPFDSPQYIHNCTTGLDGVAYSRDDGVSLDTPALLESGIVSFAHPDGLDQVIPDNPVSALAKAQMPEALLGLVHGEKESSMPVLPLVKELIYHADAVDVRGSAWLVWTKGIY